MTETTQTHGEAVMSVLVLSSGNVLSCDTWHIRKSGYQDDC